MIFDQIIYLITLTKENALIPLYFIERKAILMSTNYDVRPAHSQAGSFQISADSQRCLPELEQNYQNISEFTYMPTRLTAPQGRKRKQESLWRALKENSDYRFHAHKRLSRKRRTAKPAQKAGSMMRKGAGKAVEALSSAASEAKIDTRLTDRKLFTVLDAVLLGTVLMSFGSHSDLVLNQRWD